MRTDAKENCSGFLVQGITFYVPTDILGADSPFTLAVSHQLQSSSCFCDSPWEKVVTPPSTHTFWIHVITVPSLARECWIIPAPILCGEESSWNNLIYDDDDLSCRRCHLLLDFFLGNIPVSWCWIIFVLTYHCASTCKIISCLLLPFCLHRLW